MTNITWPFFQVNYLQFDGVDLVESAWCSMPYHEVSLVQYALPWGQPGAVCPTMRSAWRNMPYHEVSLVQYALPWGQPGAVCPSMSFAHSLRGGVRKEIAKISSKHLHSQTVRTRKLKFLENVHPHHVSHVTCHMSCVTCHISQFSSYLPFSFSFLPSCEYCEWRVFLSTGPTPSSCLLKNNCKRPCMNELQKEYCVNTKFISLD